MLMNTVGVRVAVKVRVAVSVFSEGSGRVGLSVGSGGL